MKSASFVWVQEGSLLKETHTWGGGVKTRPKAVPYKTEKCASLSLDSISKQVTG